MFSEGSATRLAPGEGIPQEKPRRSYVYAHAAPGGKYFYIGKGAGDRAWSDSRHPLWHRYVRTRLNGEFSVLILQDNLSDEEAEELESEWIAQESETLVNWINSGRKMDYAKLGHYHKLRDANRNLIANAKDMEKIDSKAAVDMYIQAISAIDDYVDIEYESGLIGQLLREERAEIGKWGEVEAIDRLSLCLVRLGRVDEAVSQARNYLNKFAADSASSACERMQKRLEKALSKKRL